jgi:hypothetical protein
LFCKQHDTLGEIAFPSRGERLTIQAISRDEFVVKSEWLKSDPAYVSSDVWRSGTSLAILSIYGVYKTMLRKG